MSVSDPIADMLTAIRNGQAVGQETVALAHSGLKAEVARLLKREGYVTDFTVEGGAKKVLRVYLKYTRDHQPVIRGIRRASSPGLRVYARSGKMPQVLGGMGTVIVSTSQGLMTGKEARTRRVGGEVLCTVW